MEVCNGSRRYPHDQIVFDGDCPCCMLIVEKTELEDEISNLKAVIDRLNVEE